MFIVTWLFDKLGYMPKIDMQIGVVKNAWPFPAEQEKPKAQVKKKPVAKKTTRKPAVKKAK